MFANKFLRIAPGLVKSRKLQPREIIWFHGTVVSGPYIQFFTSGGTAKFGTRFYMGTGFAAGTTAPATTVEDSLCSFHRRSHQKIFKAK